MEKVRDTLNKTIANVRTYYQHIISAALIILLVLIVYGNDLEILLNEAVQTEAFSHALLMPFFAGFLFYLKRDMIKASLALEKYRKKTKTKYINELIGVILCLVAFLFYWYGSYTFYPLEYHLLSLPIFIVGITLILFNFKILIVLIFPILFLLFLVPPPTEIMYTVGGIMANFNTQASYTLLKTFGLPVTLSSAYGPPTIELATSTGQPTSFAIDLPCSGIYSVIAFAMFAAFLALVATAPALKKIGLFVLGLFVFEILNIIRITTIVSVGYWFGEEFAMLVYHTVAGLLLIFIGMLLTLFVAEKILKIQVLPKRKEQTQCPKCKTSLKNLENFCLNCGKFLNLFHARISQKFWAKLFLLLLGCYMVTLSIRAPTFAIAQGPNKEPFGVASGLQNPTNVFPQSIVGYGDINYTLRFIYRDEAFESIAHQDASLMYGYFPPPYNRSSSTVYVSLNVATSLSKLHSWEVCYVTYQIAQGRPPLVSVLDSRDVQIMENPPIIARYFVFQHPLNYTQITLYWYEKALFNTGLTVEERFVRISLIILETNPTTYHKHEEGLLTFAQSIAAHWEPLKEQNLISLSVPFQQFLLVASIAFVIITGTAQYTRELRKKRNNLKIFEKFAAPNEKLLFQTIKKIDEETKVTTKKIAHALEQVTWKSPKSDELIHMLNHLQENGLVEMDIVNIKDKPQLVWKL